MPSISTLVSTAAISEPNSSVPVLSTVACTHIGTWRPNSAMAALAALIAVLIWPRSWQVSMRMASAPPRMRPRICAR